MMLGFVDTLRFDRDSAGVRLERALSLNPSMADAHLFYAGHLITVGQYEDALTHGEYALQLDPASEYVHVHANWLRYVTHRFDDALIGLRVAEATFGRKVLPLTMGETLIAMGRAGEAVDSFRELCERNPDSWHRGHLAWALAAAGQRDEARALLRELHAQEEAEYVWPLAIATAYAHLRDMEHAFLYLQRCYDDRAAWIQMPYAPTFDPFRGDDRWSALVHRIGARPPAARG